VVLFADVTADLSYTYAVERYTTDNSNTLANMGPPRHRHDVLNGGALRITKPVDEHLTAYLQYDYNRDQSNIDQFSYEQHVISTGVVWRY